MPNLKRILMKKLEFIIEQKPQLSEIHKDLPLVSFKRGGFRSKRYPWELSYEKAQDTRLACQPHSGLYPVQKHNSVINQIPADLEKWNCKRSHINETIIIITLLFNNYSMSPRWIWSDKITNERVARVGYNHFISNKGEWNNCFSKFSNRVLPPIFISTILQSEIF